MYNPIKERRNKMEHIAEAIAYIKEHRTWTAAEEMTAWQDVSIQRCTLRDARGGDKIADEIHDLLEEYGEEHDLPEGWWLEFGDEGEIWLFVE